MQWKHFIQFHFCLSSELLKETVCFSRSKIFALTVGPILAVLLKTEKDLRKEKDRKELLGSEKGLNIPSDDIKMYFLEKLILSSYYSTALERYFFSFCSEILQIYFNFNFLLKIGYGKNGRTI